MRLELPAISRTMKALAMTTFRCSRAKKLKNKLRISLTQKRKNESEKLKKLAGNSFPEIFSSYHFKSQSLYFS